MLYYFFIESTKSTDADKPKKKKKKKKTSDTADTIVMISCHVKICYSYSQ